MIPSSLQRFHGSEEPLEAQFARIGVARMTYESRTVFGKSRAHHNDEDQFRACSNTYRRMRHGKPISFALPYG